MKHSSRAVALEILVQWQESHSAVDLLLERQVHTLADARDRQLVKAIVFGVLRQLTVLDWILAELCSQPLKKVKPLALQALRIGVYQILFLDRVPPSAAINETVEALKQRKQPRWLTGFVNGVLRSADRQKEHFAAMIAAGTVPEPFCFNHPRWLVARWQHRYGEIRSKEICCANEKTPQICLRINTLLTSVAEYIALLQQDARFTVRQGSFVGEALWLDETVPIQDLPGYDAGLFSVQDEMAQLLCSLMGPLVAGDYLDGCAGLGGKTAVLAQLMAKEGRLFAVEPDGRRQQLFMENMQRLALHNVTYFCGDLAAFLKQEKRGFRGIFLDVPCSGLGVTGRHPDIRWNRQPEDLKRFQEKQCELLGQAAQLVEPGGTLVYATCSTEPEENEEVIERFLNSHAEFQLENARDYLPQKAAALVSPQGFLQTLPGEQISDGFFGARLKKIKVKG